MIEISLKKRFPTSIYEILETKNFLYVGGSDWNRRRVKYSKKIAEKSKGILWIYKKSNDELKLFKKVYFPSMVYEVRSFSKNKILVACKSQNQTLNILSDKGEIIFSKDEKIGKGIYGVEEDTKRKLIILATRSGNLLWMEKEELRLVKKLKLSKERLWSLKLKDDKAYIGDYKGKLFIVNLKSKKLIKTIDFGKKFYKNDKRLRNNLGPSLWGLDNIGNKIIIANRWGGVFVLGKGKIVKKFETEESFTRTNKFCNTRIILGTRDGKIFTMNINSGKLTPILESKKIIQKENAIYGIYKYQNHFWFCFADGDLIKLKK